MDKQLPILIVDDEEEFLRSASFALRSSGYGHVETCSDATAVLDRVGSREYSLLLLDIMMPKVSGTELLPKIVELKPSLPVIMITAVNEIEVAVECIRAGAFDYLLKPLDKPRLITAVGKAVQFSELKRENDRLSHALLDISLQKPDAFKDIVTESESMRSIFRYIEAIAPTPLPVLVCGETGSGKELIAKAVHNASGRTGEFVCVNVAGLDDTLFSDTLFGHERGSFTGADRKREGLVAKAADGTLFLDEIGDLRTESQVKLLRLLEERSYYPIGSDAQVSTNCRVVAATNAAIETLVAEGKFRKDLFYRLRSHMIRIPPLRQRGTDGMVLCKHFLRQASRELGKQDPTPPQQLFTLLSTYAFPGNVRELRGMVYDAVSRHGGGVLSMETFKEHIEESSHLIPSNSSNSVSVPVSGDGKIMFGENLPSLKEAENALVEEALRRTGNNQSLAARLLGITPSALNKRVNK